MLSSTQADNVRAVSAIAAESTQKCALANNLGDVFGSGEQNIAATVCDLRTVPEQALWARGYDNCTGSDAKQKWGKILKGEPSPEDAKQYFNGKKDITPLINQYIQLGESPENARKMVLSSFQYYAGQSQETLALQDSYTGSGYVRTNGILWRGGKSASCLQGLIEKEKKAFDTLPAYSGTVWRGVSLKASDLKDYRIGAKISWPAFSSFSMSKKVAEDYSGNGSGKPTVFKMISRHCRNLSPINGLQEKEVLCMPGTRVKVVGVEAPNIIDLEEVE